MQPGRQTVRRIYSTKSAGRERAEIDHRHLQLEVGESVAVDVALHRTRWECW